MFYKDGDYVRAIIPFALDCQAGTSYKLTFKYGAVSQDIDFTLNFRDYQKGNNEKYEVSDAVASLYSDSTKQAASDALEKLFTTGSEERYFEDAFIEPVNAHMRRFFGRKYTVTPGNTEYRQTGVEYEAADGTAVANVAKGKVVYVGSLDVTGNVVIVEHGYGLKTLYAHLGSVSVAVGDIVAQGAQIGTCGSTGFTNGPGVYVANFVGYVPISPYNMWADGNWRAFTNP